MQFELNQRLDILDKINKWLKATVVHIYSPEGKQCGVRIKLKGYTQAWDENVKIEVEESDVLYQPVGTFSNAHGWASE